MKIAEVLFNNSILKSIVENKLRYFEVNNNKQHSMKIHIKIQLISEEYIILNYQLNMLQCLRIELIFLKSGLPFLNLYN